MIISTRPTAIKRWMLEQLLGHRCKLALYVAGASLGPQTTGYTTEGEVQGKGYTAGGEPLTGGQIVNTPTGAAATWNMPKWTNATFKAGGLMIYADDLPGKPPIVIASLGQERIVENATFSISTKTFPIELK